MNRTKTRSITIQTTIIIALIAIFTFFGYNYIRNITSRNIGIGFGFMHETAGFSISQTLISYTESDTFGRTFVIGLLNTLVASIIGIVLATLLGFLIGLMRLSKNKLIHNVAVVYVEVLRNIPPLLHVLFWYQVVFLNVLPPFKESFKLGNWLYINVRGITIPSFIPQTSATTFRILFFVSIVAIFYIGYVKKKMVLRGVHKKLWPLQLAILLALVLFAAIAKPFQIVLPEITKFKFSSGTTIRPELFSVVVALGTYTSTYISEAVRSSIIAVPKGQLEAAKSLGFNRYRRLQLIIIPQAMRTMIPPVTNQYLNLIKNTSLGMAVAYPDLTSVFAGTTLNQTGRALEVMSLVMLTYLSISLVTSLLMNWYNRSIINKKGEMLAKEEVPLD
ncbi:amino acid ABC transporter permease [Sediminispirochaeta smaragdinae]|jgi:general L-amino acid transport system permease protein|uniref:Polar amino acid ABC transporter, inner membrane subunit n=1 Tax=Sediminispirochaeta smaragdinae (strain DSM 11293 / JCM 15392 / SEBR 4228) TaxID=573413 RepID=E1RAN1_SEDSS|nr:ABC transporter permease subunit [Sediminispirochaeta smaragdinae]ADK82399.1 polar amino acid ABC transporter, inner membrane subunit [Sediminispirochaeta smaragdinae DSM 11293]